MPLLISFFLVLILFAWFFVAQFYDSVFRGYAPFISSGNFPIKKIMEELSAGSVKEGAVVYELGCGEAGFLRVMENKFKNLRLVGIEYSFLPYLVSRMQVSLLGSGIKVVKGDFFEQDLSDADIIYCYLSVESMDKLAPKFRRECQPGTLIISNRFTLPSFSPEKILFSDSKDVRDKIYFYRV